MKSISASLAVLMAAVPAICGAQSQTDRFELACKSSEAGGGELRFIVFIFVNGTEVTDLGKSPPVDYPASAYVNAMAWNDGVNEFTVDRFTGVLRVMPASRTYSCEKVGGKKF